MEIDEKALNEKLAKWASVKYCRYWSHPGHDDRLCDGPIPNFTQSLDACFKYLMPKLIKEKAWNTELRNSPYYPNQFQVVIDNSLNPHLKRYQAQSENQALALCLAIGQLVDKETI